MTLDPACKRGARTLAGSSRANRIVLPPRATTSPRRRPRHQFAPSRRSVWAAPPWREVFGGVRSKGSRENSNGAPSTGSVQAALPRKEVFGRRSHKKEVFGRRSVEEKCSARRSLEKECSAASSRKDRGRTRATLPQKDKFGQRSLEKKCSARRSLEKKCQAVSSQKVRGSMSRQKEAFWRAATKGRRTSQTETDPPSSLHWTSDHARWSGGSDSVASRHPSPRAPATPPPRAVRARQQRKCRGAEKQQQRQSSEHSREADPRLESRHSPRHRPPSPVPRPAPTKSQPVGVHGPEAPPQRHSGRGDGRTKPVQSRAPLSAAASVETSVGATTAQSSSRGKSCPASQQRRGKKGPLLAVARAQAPADGSRAHRRRATTRGQQPPRHRRRRRWAAGHCSDAATAWQGWLKKRKRATSSAPRRRCGGRQRDGEGSRASPPRT